MMLRNYLEEQSSIPYETLNVMIGAITYGGRVTDKMDKICNVKILSRYIVPDIMEDDYKLSDSGFYYAPKEGSLQAVQEYIENLPDVDKPEAYGLHANAATSYFFNETKEILNTLTTMEGSGSGAGSGDSDTARVLKLIESVLGRMPPAMIIEDAHPDTVRKIADGSMNSLGVFVIQEATRFNKLRSVVVKTLTNLKKAIQGLVVMSLSLEDMFVRLCFNRVPKTWEDAAYPSLKPLSPWIEDFFMRLEDIGGWLSSGPPNAFWVSGFFFPQGFVTAVLQTYSRATKTAVDTLTLDTLITSKFTKGEIEKPPEHGVYVYGLYIQGARFDVTKMKMSESKPGVLFELVPVIHFNPLTFEQFDLGTRYECPLYKTSRRAGTLSTTGHSTNFVRALAIETDVNPDHWIRRGVALLCMLDD